MRTIRPLDYGKRVVGDGHSRRLRRPEAAARTRHDKGVRVFATFVDQFADNRVGVALSAAYTSDPYQTRDWNAWGYSDFPGGAQGMYGVKTWFETDQLKRFGDDGNHPGPSQRQSDDDARRLLFALHGRHRPEGL